MGSRGSGVSRSSTVKLDAVGRTAVVAVGVGLGRIGVGDLDGLDVHGERTLGVVCDTAGPLDGALGLAGVTTSPDTDSQGHGSLREVIASSRSLESADIVAINGPGDGVLRPVDGVGVDGGLGRVDIGVGGTVVRGSVALAEVVGLDGAGLATKGFL